MKRKLLLAALCVVGAMGGVNSLSAQTNVTSTYLTNADFESGTAATANVTTYVAPSSWTIVNGGNGAAGTAAYGSSYKVNKVTPPSSADSEFGSNCYIIQGAWLADNYIYQSVSLPAGSYQLVYYVRKLNNKSTINTNNTGFYIDSSNKWFGSASDLSGASTSSYTKRTVNMTIDETKTVQIQVGYKATNVGSDDASALAFDNIELYYTDFKAELRAVVAQAQAINSRISTLSDDITTAQGVLNTADASKLTIDNAVTTLRSAISTKLAAYTGLNAAGDDITSFIANNGFETSPTFDGTSLGSGSNPKSNATPTDGSTLLFNAKNVYQINGWELLTTETSDFARTFTLPYAKTIYVWGNNAVAGQEVASPTNGSSVTTSNDNLLFVEANWCENAVLGVKQTVPLPAGSYRLTFDSYVSNAIGNAESRCGVSYSETTDYKWPAALNTWTNNEVDFTLDAQTDVTISMGYKKIGNVGGGSSAHLYVDNVKLTYFDPLKLAQIQWQETRDALDALDETALPDAAEEAITDALAETEPTTVDGYNTAKAALQALIDSYDRIKAAYDKANDLITFVTSEVTNSTGTKTTIEAAISTATTNIETRTVADDLVSDYNTLEAARQTYVTSGAEPDADHPFDYTFKLTNPSFESTTTGWTVDRNTTGTWNYDIRQNDPVDGNDNLNVWAQQINYINVYQNVTLAEGSYSLKGYLYSDLLKAQHIYANNGADNPSSNLTSSASWTQLTANFTQTSESSVKLGIYSQGNNLNNDSYGWFRADHFQLFYNGMKPLLDDVIDNATTLSTSNIGTGVFQVPSAAAEALTTAKATAQGVYEDADAYGDAITTAINNLNDAITTFQGATLNAPAADKHYYLKVATTGHVKEGNAVVVALGSTSENNPTGYTFNASAAPAAYLAQAVAFTSANDAEHPNRYYITFEGPEGTLYLTNGTLTGSAAGWKASQIQGTTDPSKKMGFDIVATATANVFNIYNTETNSSIACQTAGNLYTESGNANFTLAEASQASVDINIKDGKWATRIFPFAPELPNGLVAYTAEVNGDALELTEVKSPVANVPYILKNNTGDDITSTSLTGYGTADGDSYAKGVLIGIYTDATIPDGSYVLQTPISTRVQAFYPLATTLTGTPYRCYLALPNSAAKRNAIFFDKEEGTTGIEAPNATNGEDGVFYNLAGQRVNRSYKGIIIQNRKAKLNN